MRYVIIGASGALGKNLVPLVCSAGRELLLVGRDETKLQKLFPGHTAISYGKLDEYLKPTDIIIHLAVVNTNSSAPVSEFYKVNFALVRKIRTSAEMAGVKSIVYFTTSHALNLFKQTKYAKSKRAGERVIVQTVGTNVFCFFIPKVTTNSAQVAGGALGRFLARIKTNGLKLLTPTVSMDLIFKEVVKVSSCEISKNMLITDSQENNAIYSMTKRLFDLLFSSLVLASLSWLIFLCWLAVKLDSSGPGFFVQRRVGRHGELFSCIKLRTMQEDTLEAGTHLISKRKLTRVGSFLRKTKIDELPQFLNVLKNEMSIVGPRPCLPSQLDLIDCRDKYGIFALKPGITGLSQVCGYDMEFEDALTSIDYQYVKLRCVTLDLKLVVGTVVGAKFVGLNYLPKHFEPSSQF